MIFQLTIISSFQRRKVRGICLNLCYLFWSRVFTWLYCKNSTIFQTGGVILIHSLWNIKKQKLKDETCKTEYAHTTSAISLSLKRLSISSFECQVGSLWDCSDTFGSGDNCYKNWKITINLFSFSFKAGSRFFFSFKSW